MPTLYTFGGSVWAAAAELAVAELYPAGHIEYKVINLVEGANFDPTFLKLNPKATLPTLEADGNVYTSTAEVVSYLVNGASVQVDAEAKEIIDIIHEEQYDPNFALLLFRNDEERKAKAASIPGLYLAQRQNALEKFSAAPEGQPYAAFYESKLVSNGGLLTVLQGNAPQAVTEDLFKRSQAHFDSVTTALYEILPKYLPTAGYIGGERPGNADFHVAAWLGRIAAVSGAKNGEDAASALAQSFGKPLPGPVIEYIAAWASRESWKQVYASGLH